MKRLPRISEFKKTARTPRRIRGTEERNTGAQWRGALAPLIAAAFLVLMRYAAGHLPHLHKLGF